MDITVTTTVNVPVEKVWEYWTMPEHIIKWNYASDDWHTTIATNDLQEGGKFLSRMEAKDGSFGFDFSGVYNEVKLFKLIRNTLDDGRNMSVTFTPMGDKTLITEVFEAEGENSPDMQKKGWQAILDNFKIYVESQV